MGETTRKRKKGTAGRCGAKAWAGDAEISKWNPTKEMTNQQCKTLFTTVNYKRESQPTIHLLLMARLKYSNGSLYGLVLFSSSATIFCHHLWQPSESDSFSTRSFYVLLPSSFPPPHSPFPFAANSKFSYRSVEMLYLTYDNDFCHKHDSSKMF